MNDRTIEHEADVRSVIQDEIASFNSSDLLLAEIAPSDVSGSYSKEELDNIFDGYSDTINYLMGRLEEVGILQVYHLP